MPKMDGFEMCRQLRSDPATRDIPVIFLTSLESAVDEEYGLSLGAEDFIHKPSSPPVVLARVRNHLLLAGTRRELMRHNTELERVVEERTRDVMLRERQLIAAQSATLTAFCALAEVRDNETGNHIRRTQLYVEALARELSRHPEFRGQLDDDTIRLIARAAPLHDIGKVGVTDAVLLKPQKLTIEEWVLMRQHCIIGRDAINAAARELAGDDAFLRYAAEIALCHHEWWDGSGYPQGLAGNAIPLSARLMAIGDVYDALTSRRIYKEAYSHEASIRTMVEEAGTHFDPRLIDAMVAIADRYQSIAQRYQD
jgi:putative two-component system response regulator